MGTWTSDVAGQIHPALRPRDPLADCRVRAAVFRRWESRWLAEAVIHSKRTLVSLVELRERHASRYLAAAAIHNSIAYSNNWKRFLARFDVDDPFASTDEWRAALNRATLRYQRKDAPDAHHTRNHS